MSAPCIWRCGDDTPDHDHYRVIVREGGKLLGGLTPDGRAARNVIYQVVLSKSRADSIADDINNRPDDLTATVVAAR